MHLSAGKPVSFFANCSRADSFCEAFSLPRVYAEDGETISEEELISAIERLQSSAAFDAFAKQYRHFYEETVKFLTLNGLPHNLKASPGSLS